MRNLVSVVAVLLLGACGGHHYFGFDAGDDDAIPDAAADGPAVDAAIDGGTGTWSHPEPAAFNTDNETETMASASPAATELYFAAQPAGSFILDIYYATRTGPDFDWSGTRTAVGAINTSQMETEPCISVDGLEMVFRRASTLYRTTRGSVGSAWGTATTTGLDGSFPDLLADNVTMYYRDSAATCPVDTCRTRVTRADPSSPWGNPVVESINDAGAYQMVDISGDGLRALLSGPSMTGVAPVSVASRANRTDPWGPAQPISELVIYTGIRWAHWSWDETEMYLGYSSGANDVYVSRLTP